MRRRPLSHQEPSSRPPRSAPAPSAPQATAARPRVESGPWLSGDVVFVDAQGTHWRVHDVAHGPHVPHAPPGGNLILAPPSPRAHCRLFVREGADPGSPGASASRASPGRPPGPALKKCYRFAANEIRAVTLKDLERQWRKAAYADADNPCARCR